MAPKKTAQTWRGTLPLATGIIALFVLVGGLGVWLVRTEISGAVVASGMVQVESNRQVVEHLDGGMVGEILVKDGDIVEAGDVLIRLDGQRVKSELTIVQGQLQEIMARQARLRAERDDADTVEPDEELLALAADSPEIRQIIKGEVALFDARRAALAQEVDLLGEQNRQITNRIEGIEAQLQALRTQRDLLEQQLTDQQSLLKQQLTQRSQVVDLQREEADFLGQIGRLEAEIAELRGQAAGNAIEVLQLRTRRQEEAATELRDMQYRQAELLEKRSSLLETISRLNVRAPVGGVIYNTQVFAVQSVAQPGEPLMYVIPQDQPLVVSSQINGINIDEVYVGQEAILQFSSFNQRDTPEVRGQISRISADVIKDETTGLNYYSAEILPYQVAIAALGDQTLVPGMPVEVFIKTSDRTAFEYLTQPLMNFFNRSFRE
ncbi:HlyD family type I secretion periplasmic adaptor subunit [Roseovarius sp. Pro17]|uniref:HlyD family type I secretion periplasmic adaptor subunit n=1 Tax=Roseovarius sp. Pro17 TaxID=3108175 RepID=UPI002D7691D9|nr:HlyD family type I secretion periplasmic adaptor subunit [Roseovarius sp. Pro17]